MKRYMLWSMFVLAAIVVALTGRAAVAGDDRPFEATTVISFQGWEDPYEVMSGPGVGTVVGEFWAVFFVKPEGVGNSKKVVGSITITSHNGDLLVVDMGGFRDTVPNC